MSKSNRKPYRKILSKFFNVEKKQIKLSENKDGSYKLKIKSLSTETLNEFLDFERLERSKATLQDSPSESLTTAKIEDDSPLCAIDPNQTPTTSYKAIEMDLSLPLTAQVESIKLPFAFNEISLPCDCTHCRLKNAYDLLIKARTELKQFSSANTIPTRKKAVANPPLKTKYNQLRAKLKLLNKTYLSFCRHFLGLVGTLSHPFIRPHPSNTNLLPTSKPKPNSVSYLSVAKEKVLFTIPSNCLNQSEPVEVVALPSEATLKDDKDSIANLNQPNSLYQVDEPTLKHAPLHKCIHCEIHPIVLKLRHENSLHNKLCKNIKNLHRESQKAQKLKKNKILNSLCTLRKEKIAIVKRIKEHQEVIAQLLCKYKDVVQPHPTLSSVSALKDLNMISYLSEDNIRVRLLLVKSCINH